MTDDFKPDSSTVPLPIVEFVDRCIHSEVKRLEDLFAAQSVAHDKTMAIQMREISRRLDELNHVYDKAREERSEYLSKATYETFLSEYSKWRDETNRTISNAQGRAAAYVSILGVLFLFLQIAFRVWGK